tara:strand:+ start:384 stop:554 length:171 start_codon:yes stop_codon:yes gene_type:complete
MYRLKRYKKKTIKLKMNKKIERTWDWWNHKINPITGFVEAQRNIGKWGPRINEPKK